MSISYSAIVGRGGNMTLPSVAAGLGSLNILRDPPKSIMTRRINKVGETSSLTEMQDASGDRACEAISLYARGTNPMVSVSYNNYGNNGGQRSGNLLVNGGGAQAFSPYTIAKDGAFRPPIITARQMTPLSRLPRELTSAYTQPGFADFTKKMMCPGGDYRSIKQQSLKACVRPTAVYKIETPAIEPFEVKYVIKNPIKVKADSGFRTRDLTSQIVTKPSKEINSNFSNMHAKTNYGSSDTVQHVDNSMMDTERYLKDSLVSSVQSKQSRNIQTTSIEDIMDLNIRTKDAVNISYTAPLSSHTKEDHIHADPQYNRRVVNATAVTNRNKNIYVRPETQYQKSQERNRPIATAVANHGSINRQPSVDIGSRSYSLIPKIKAGGFEGRVQKPMLDRNVEIGELFESDKVIMNRKINNMQQERYYM